MLKGIVVLLLTLSIFWTWCFYYPHSPRVNNSVSVYRNVVTDMRVVDVGRDFIGSFYWGEGSKVYVFSDDWDGPYFDFCLDFDLDKYVVMGGFRKYVAYVDGGIMASPLRPPIAYVLYDVGVPVGFDVVGVGVINYTVVSVFLNETFFVSPSIRFDFVDYPAEIERAYSVEPILCGVYPEDFVLDWVVLDDTLRVKIALTQYNLSSGDVDVLLSIGIRVYLEENEGKVFRARQSVYDVVIITSSDYVDKAQIFASNHPEYSFLVVDTEYIYRNYEEAEAPPFDGFRNSNHPKWSVLSGAYNFSLALRIISYLRDVKRYGVKYVILFGNVIDVPPSYYYWDDGYYSLYRNAYQSWIPTDFFYASPDYDFYPEYAVGRIPFISGRDADKYVEKVGRWLDAFRNGTEWKRRMTVIGGMPFGMLYYSGEATILDIINSGYTGNFTVEKFFETNALYTLENVRSVYNGGRIFVLEFSHGSETAFYKLSKYDYRWIRLIDVGYLGGLSNSSELPIVIAPACTSGAFDYGIFDGKLKNSLGQAIIFSNAGGIAYLGMSRVAFGALTFYFDDGVLEAPFLLFAQAMLKVFFKAYFNGSDTLGMAYRDALTYYVLENDMDYWINIRTLFEFCLLGDPLIPLPKITGSGTPPQVRFSREPKKIRIPLTFGHAIQYEDNLISLDVLDDGLVRYELISPMIVESFSRPLAFLNYSSPSSISFSLPSGGLYILKIIDDTEKEKRVYVRSIGAEFRRASLEFIDSNRNGRYELVRLNITVDLKYYSKTAVIWGFRSWIRMYFAGEKKFRINRNEFFRAIDVGERVLSYVFDSGALMNGNNILNIEFFLFSWWPYLFTWWYSGPSIWIEFAVRLIATIPDNLENAVEVALIRAEPMSLDNDQGVEAADLYFRLRINCRLEGNLEVMIYFQRRVIGKSGGVIYFLSTLIPFIIPTYKDEVTIRYVWGLKAWYAKAWWGSKPNESESQIIHYYSMLISLRTKNMKLTISNTGNRRIHSLDNVTADSSESNEIIIENIEVSRILDTNNNTVGITIYFTGYSKTPHFERTEIIIEKYEDGAWTQIYRKELIMGIFIFFWPATRTRFKACQIPIEFLGNGTFRVKINAFKYSGGRKIILASAEKIFNITDAYSRLIKNVYASLVDKDEDSKYGHMGVSVSLSRSMEIVQLQYEIYYNVDGSDIILRRGKITKYFTDNVSAIVGLNGEDLVKYDNVSLKVKISITARDADALASISYGYIITLISNASGTIFEGNLEDYEKSLIPVVFLTNSPNFHNSSNLVIQMYVFSWFSAAKNISVMLNDTEVLSESVGEYSNITINLTDLKTGVYDMSICIHTLSGPTIYSYEFIVDLLPPKINVFSNTIDNMIRIKWSIEDISGIDRVEIYVNGTLLHVDNNAGGTWTYDAPEGLWNVTIVAYDKAYWFSKEQVMIVVDKTPPIIELLSPRNTTIVSYGPVNVSWQAYDQNGIAATKIIIDMANIFNVNNSSVILRLSPGSHIVAIKVYDVAGNEGSIYIRVNIAEKEPEFQTPSLNNSDIFDNLESQVSSQDHFNVSNSLLSKSSSENRFIILVLISLIVILSFASIVFIMRSKKIMLSNAKS